MVEYNFNKLKGKIREVYKTQNDFAIAMKMAPNTLSSKLNNTSDFSISEINTAFRLLGIASASEAWNIFFTKKVEDNSTKNK